MQNKKVIFFLVGLDNGGLENYLLRFLNHEHKKFSEILVFIKKKKSDELLNKFQMIPNINIIDNDFNYYNISCYLKLFILLRKENPNSICDFSGNIAVPILILSKMAGIKKRVLFYRNSSIRFNPTFFNITFDNILRELSKLFATKILCNSKAGLDFYYPTWKMKGNKFEVIYNGIDVNKCIKTNENIRLKNNIPKDAFLIGHVGRYNLAKNHDTILKVALILCKEMSDFYFILCGRDVDVNLNQWIDFHNLKDRIIVLGNQLDVNSIYSDIDCFYFPSTTEGQPNALIESMSFDIPFVASNISPIKETVPFEYHSYLVDPFDVNKAVQKILDIYYNGFPNGLKKLVSKKFDSNILFHQFYKKL